MQKTICITISLFLVFTILPAQNPNLPDTNGSALNPPARQLPPTPPIPKPPKIIQDRKAIPYPYLREADVMWSKRIWRIIDINEKINLVFKWPKSESTNDRENLLDIILHGIKEGGLTAYDADELLQDEFAKPYTRQEIETMIAGRMDTKMIKIPDPPYEIPKPYLKGELKRDDVFAYELKEDWYFDKQRSEMKVRIIGICPISFVRDDAGDLKPGEKKKLFWIYFPEARQTFANAEVFNTANDAERRSWDDIFFKRKFNSYIIKESNVYDRHISEYKIGMDALLEAESIKNKMIDYEHDIWEY